jgi:tRNA-Thr(GGU) m(6)t(6)A37 methyltransferase TsaA
MVIINTLTLLTLTMAITKGRRTQVRKPCETTRIHDHQSSPSIQARARIETLTPLADRQIMRRSAAIDARDAIVFQPIGTLRTPHRLVEHTPVQPVYARGCPGQAEVLPPYHQGLRDLEGFSHVILLYHLHKAGPPQLIVQPFTGDRPCGVFATRHPQRPNPIGLSLVRLVRVEGGILHLLDVDMLDGTPLLDIKPFVPRFDRFENARGGWTEAVDDAIARQRGERGFSP